MGATVGTILAAMKPHMFIQLPTTEENLPPMSFTIVHDSVWATPAMPRATLIQRISPSTVLAVVLATRATAAMQRPPAQTAFRATKRENPCPAGNRRGHR